VRSADLNYIRRVSIVPNDPDYGRQWHYPLINLPQAWEITIGGNDVIVAVIDTGVLVGHPDLAGRLTDGYDFIRSSAIALDGDGIDADPDDPGDQAPGGSSFHGTHVAGTIASTTNNAVGVSGVTWNTRIMPLRALGRGGGTSYDVMQAVRYAAGLPNDTGSVPSPIADIVNLSLGGGGYSQSEQNVFTQARNRGVIIVAAAGNASSRSPSYPAAYDGVVSVGAVDYNKNLAWYSNFGDRVDVAAPGGDMGADANVDGFPDGVLSTCGEDDSGRIRFTYCFYQGTSMAAPHMAGVVALMKARNALLRPNDLDAWLISGAITEDLGPPGRDDRFGYGLIDALEAVGAAAGSVPAVLRINPASLRFGPTNAGRTFELKNAGTNDGIIVSSVTADVPWLTVSPAIPPNIGLNPADTAELVLSVDRNHPRLSSDGIYEAQLVISTDAVNDILTVPVSVQVGTSFVGGNAGTHYVVLVDPETLFTRAQVRVDYNPAAMGYAYLFTGVPAGTYQILAGTDSDNDFFIGDPGEAFGAYLTLDQTVSIRVAGNTGGLDFFTSFDFGLSPDRLAADRSNTGRFFMRTQ
jgi:serine protease